MCSVPYNTFESAQTGRGWKFYVLDITMRETWFCWSFKNAEISEGHQMLQKMLENRDKGNRKDHHVKRDEKASYKQVVQVVDLVHKYLGLRKGESILYEVYMSF